MLYTVYPRIENERPLLDVPPAYMGSYKESMWVLVSLLAAGAAVRIGVSPRLAPPRAAVTCSDGRGGGRGRNRSYSNADAASRALLMKLEALPSTKAMPVDTMALGRFVRSTEGRLRGPLLTKVLSALKHKNRWQLALAIGKLLDTPMVPSAPRRAHRRDCLHDCADEVKAISSLDLTGASPLHTIHYNVLISCCACPRKWREALMLLERMRQRGVPRETITYNSLLDVMNKAGRWKLALRLLREMRAEDVPPNTITFSTAISACARVGEWQRALQLLAYMRASRVMPNTITYSAAIAACERAGEWKRALLLLEQMKEEDVRPDLIIINAAIGALAKAGEWERATVLLEQESSGSQFS